MGSMAPNGVLGVTLWDPGHPVGLWGTQWGFGSTQCYLWVTLQDSGHPVGFWGHPVLIWGAPYGIQGTQLGLWGTPW